VNTEIIGDFARRWLASRVSLGASANLHIIDGLHSVPLIVLDPAYMDRTIADTRTARLWLPKSRTNMRTMKAKRRRTFALRSALMLMLLLSSSAHPSALSAQAAWHAVDSLQVVYTEASSTDSVPAGEVVGVVLDAYKGTPLSNSGVVAYDSLTKSRFATTATEQGRFHLRGLKPGSWTIRAELFGYATRDVAVDARAGSVVRFGLPGVHIELCADEIGPQPAIITIVRDVRTGRAPHVSVTLRVQSDSLSYSETKAAPSAPSDSIFWIGAGSRWSRFYSVELRAKGYATWRIPKIELQKRGCGGYFERTLDAWLLPD